MKNGALLVGLGLMAEPDEARLTLAQYQALRSQGPGSIFACQPPQAWGGRPAATDYATGIRHGEGSQGFAVKLEKLN